MQKERRRAVAFSSKRGFWALALIVLGLLFSLEARALYIDQVSPLAISRYLHTSTLLQSGKVLIVGGLSTGGATTNSAELYDPTTGTTALTSFMATGRNSHTATLLPNGKVLVAGGLLGATVLASCELYDPTTGTWSTTGSLNTARTRHTATLLTNGMVLVAGGGFNGLSSSELYDPSTGVWTPTTGSMTTARAFHTATLLTNGLVLVAGGSQNVLPTTYLSSAELFNPATGLWTATAVMTSFRQSHTATLLANGTVLAAGGFNGSAVNTTSETYDPVAQSWTSSGSLAKSVEHQTAILEPDGTVLMTGGDQGTASTSVNVVQSYNPGARTWANFTIAGHVFSLSAARTYLTATLLANGQTLIAGGENTSSVATNNVDLFDFTDWPFSTANSMASARRSHTATLLPNGKVLVAGGDDSSFLPITGAELFDPASGNWSNAGPMNFVHAAQTATLLTNGQVLIAGGDGAGSVITNSAELYDPVAGSWSITGSMTSPRYAHTATLLLTGKVLVAGGQTVNPLSTAELYDPVAKTWATTGSMNYPHARHQAVMLSNGKVLIVGGVTNGAFTSAAAAEIYDPGTGTWTLTGSMITAREYFTASLMPSGEVLAAGGLDPTLTLLSSAELYDPVAGTWSATTGMPTVRDNQQTTLRIGGKVMLSGGLGTGNATQTSAVSYDPLTRSWQTEGNMSTARYQHTATLLTNGQVLFAGGSSGTGSLSSAEIFEDEGTIAISSRPQIASATLSGTLSIMGSQLGGVSEASGGNGDQNSPVNYPVVELRGIGNDITVFPILTNWSATSCFSVPVTTFSNGYVLATVIADGIPSYSRIIPVLSPGATVTLGNLSQQFDGTAKSVSVITSPPGLAVTVTYNGSTAPPYDSGSYAVVATITASGYTGSTNGTLVISPFSSLRHHGLDVSHFQNSNGVSQASWNQIYSNGQFFTFVKASEGLTGPDDPTMSINLARAQAAGLLAGVYHFAHPENRPTTNGAIMEADHFLSYAGSAIGPGYLRPVLDLEEMATNQTGLTDWVIAFSNEIQAQRGANAAPIVYTTPSFTAFLDSRVANYDLWLLYGFVGDPTNSSPPTGVFNNWSFWQYNVLSSGGLSPVDFDICHDDFKPLSSFLIPTTATGPISIGASTILSNGTFQIAFTNTPGTGFTVLTATNAGLPLSKWTILGAATETSSGNYQFADTQATNNPRRFYRIRSP